MSVEVQQELLRLKVQLAGMVVENKDLATDPDRSARVDAIVNRLKELQNQQPRIPHDVPEEHEQQQEQQQVQEQRREEQQQQQQQQQPTVLSIRVIQVFIGAVDLLIGGVCINALHGLLTSTDVTTRTIVIFIVCFIGIFLWHFGANAVLRRWKNRRVTPVT